MLTTTKGRDLVASLPRDRVLTETDGLFTTVDSRPAAPHDIVGTITLLAERWDIPIAEAEGQISANLQVLLARQPGARRFGNPA